MSGSIPARAGEPVSPRPSWIKPAVYPRACGGTHRTPGVIVETKGLSPRVRGNLGDVPVATDKRRSIPARAGEPYAHGQYECDAEVYPRACGGTW